jgi:hypothetical protein
VGHPGLSWNTKVRPQSTARTIMNELRALRATVDELASDTKQRITALEAMTKPLFDNGQPGRITKIETRVTGQERWKVYVIGSGPLLSRLLLELFGGYVSSLHIFHYYRPSLPREALCLDPNPYPSSTTVSYSELPG